MTFYSIRNILVPLDLSEPSLNALDTAVALAKKNNAGLLLLYVEETLMSVGEGFVAGQPNKDILTALSGAVKHTHGILPSVIEAKGPVVETVINVSQHEACDLIVMGTHGASGLRDGFVGSNTYNVIKYASCPVLTVPPHKKFTAFRKALFPIRAMPGALRSYDVAGHFLAADSEVDVLGLSNLKHERERTGVLEKVVDEIRDRLKTKKINMTTVWAQGGSAANDILQYARQTNPELIVLTPMLDAASKSNYIGPHAQKVIHCSRLPLLNIKKGRVAEKLFVGG